MTVQSGRYTAPAPATSAEGWTLERLTPPSRLFGANGVRTGADGRVYVAQVSGSQISAIDIETGEVETISPLGGDIVGPDDIVFDDEGNLYATEITEGRVSVRSPNGRVRIIQGDMPVANPITFHQGRLIAGELRVDGRIMELDRNGGAPRLIAENLPMPNAFAVGPDGLLYFPLMGANEIWRVGLEGGAPEVVARDLGVPDAVKFDSKGRIVSTQIATGQVLRIDPKTGAKEMLAQLDTGLDNLTFVGDRLFVSNIAGSLTEVYEDGRSRLVTPGGFNWPLGLALDPTGLLYVADGFSSILIRPGGGPATLTNMFSPGYPGNVRGVAATGPGAFVTTSTRGEIARYWPAEGRSEPIAEGFDQLYGVAVAAGGAVIAAELGTGRVLSFADGKVEVLAQGLDRPTGVAVGADGACFVSEAGAGRISRLAGGRSETVLDGLQKPQGIAVRDGRLYVLDAAAKALIELDLANGARRTLASLLPVGAPPGVTPKPLKGVGDFSGPNGPFAAIAAAPDGAIYVSADGEGSVLAIRPS